MNAPANTSISERLATFAAGLRDNDIPAAVRKRAQYLILDAAGIALASGPRDYARAALAGLLEFGTGNSPVIGKREQLAMRDAIVMNGVLIHGLDYDDTHPEGVMHSTASCFPAALAVAAQTAASGREFLTAFILGTEIAARLGMVARGALHEAGFHPTGMLAAFSAALIAGRLLKLDATQMTMAQGLALSTGSSSSRQYNRDAAGSKRLHPGWGAAAGVTAAALAKHGMTGPRAVYEGDYGLYPAHLGARYQGADLPAATTGLGEIWETLNVGIKPMPACLHVHASVDAAAQIASTHAIKPDEIASINVLIPHEAIAIVCEPAAMRKRPTSGYGAQFSLPFAVACGLVRRRFTLAELEPAAYNDPVLLALAAKVNYAVDPDTEYPRYFSGEVRVRTTDGRELRQREHINRGSAGRPLNGEDIAQKFNDNALLATTAAHAASIEEAILAIDTAPDLGALTTALRAPATSNQ